MIFKFIYFHFYNMYISSIYFHVYIYVTAYNFMTNHAYSKKKRNINKFKKFLCNDLVAHLTCYSVTTVRSLG